MIRKRGKGEGKRYERVGNREREQKWNQKRRRLAFVRCMKKNYNHVKFNLKNIYILTINDMKTK